MKNKSSPRDRIHYFLDTIYSRGTGPVILSLGLMTFFLACIATLIIYFARLAPGGEESYSFIEAAWVGMLSAIGEGSIGGRESTWTYRILMLALSFGSIFVGSFFISALTNGLVNRVSELKRGRSKIVEQNHTVVLGWSDQIFTIISELDTAQGSLNGNNKGQKSQKGCIAILAPVEKASMEEQVRSRLGDLRHMRIVCRTGDAMEMTDLQIVSLATCHNIIILPSSSSYPDAEVIKTVLAITNDPNRRKSPYQIVAWLRNPRNMDIAQVVGRDEVQWVVGSEIISRIIAQTSLQPGLSAVYDDLFNFANQEIYYKEPGDLVGKTFGQAQLACENNVPIGVFTTDQLIRLNPSPETLIVPGDQLILIAEDDRKISTQPLNTIPIYRSAVALGPKIEPSPKDILILGWNWRGCKIVSELDFYLQPGSTLTVLADQDKVDEAITNECGVLNNLKMKSHIGDTDDRQMLEGITFNHFDHIIILGYSDKLSAQRADAKSLVSLLHLRDIKDLNQLKCTIVTEMMDIRNYQLASTVRADDYIVSDRMISLIMAQIAQNKQRYNIIQEILNPDSSEIYLKPVEYYVKKQRPVNFFTVTEAARLRKEIALGYRLAAKATDSSQKFGVVINPTKAAEVTFNDGDQIIVFAEAAN
jgi:ion channel POLLUX/CASTOR